MRFRSNSIAFDRPVSDGPWLIQGPLDLLGIVDKPDP